jgi:hypothetical protein
MNHFWPNYRAALDAGALLCYMLDVSAPARVSAAALDVILTRCPCTLAGFVAADSFVQGPQSEFRQTNSQFASSTTLTLRLIRIIQRARFALPLVTAGFLSMLVWPANAESDAATDQVSFHKLQQDVKVAELLRRLQAEAPHGTPIIFRNVQVVNPETEIVTPAQTVVVTGSRITWVGDSDKAPPVSSGMVVEGNDRFLSPGLVDMHVHSSSAAGWLLDLDNGVTTVRDMDGFPWLLKLRDSVNARRMLAPIDIVAGTTRRNCDFSRSNPV